MLIFIWYVVVTWISRDEEKTVGRFVSVSWLIGECSITSKGPMFNYKEFPIWNVRDTISKQCTKDFTLWSWPYSIHPRIHSYFYTFIQSSSMNVSNFLHQVKHSHFLIHSCPIIHPSMIHSSIHPLIYLSFLWSGGSASVNKIVK